MHFMPAALTTVLKGFLWSFLLHDIMKYEVTTLGLKTLVLRRRALQMNSTHPEDSGSKRQRHNQVTLEQQ